MNGEQVGGPNQPQTNAEGTVAFDSAQIANTQAAQEKDYFKAKPQGTKSARFKDWLKQHKAIAIIILALVLALIVGAICLAIWLNRPPASDAEREAAGMIGASTNENIESGFNAATNLEELIAEPSTSEDDLVAAINAELDKITDGAERFSYILQISTLLTDYGRANLALEYLQAIDETTLDEDQQLIYYSYLHQVYTALGDDTQAESYKQKMSEITGGEIQGYGTM